MTKILTQTQIIPQIEDTTIFRYPFLWRRWTTIIWVSILGLNLAEYALEWVRAVYAWLASPLQLPSLFPLLDPSQSVLPTLLVSHIGLFAALLTARAAAYLIPDVDLSEQGLEFKSAMGVKLIPYTALRGLRSVELPGGRFVVWVDARKGLPLQNWLASLILGRFVWSGFLLTSDIEGFDQIVARVAAELKRQFGEDGFASRCHDELATWLLLMVDSPRATLHEIATADLIPITGRDTARNIVSAVLALALPAAVAGLIQLEFPWGAFVVVLVSVFEFPLVSLYLTAIPIGQLQEMAFQEAIRVYPLTQLPRWVAGIGLALLVIAGAPLVLAVPIGLLAIAYGSFLPLLLTEAWFDVHLPESILGILVTLIYQVLIYEILIAVLIH